MKTTYKATVKETGEQREFASVEEIKEWAARATITFQTDLTLSVVKVVETETTLSASYDTGDVKEVAA